MDQTSKYHHLCPEERAFIMLERDQGADFYTEEKATIVPRTDPPLRKMGFNRLCEAGKIIL